MDWLETQVIEALPAPIVRLAARAGVAVAGLQQIAYRPPANGRGRAEREMGPASLWCLDRQLRRRLAIDAPGQLYTVCLDAHATRIGVVSRMDDQSTLVQVLDAVDGRLLASRRFVGSTVFGLALHDDIVAIGRHLRSWTPDHGPKVELYRLDLTTLVDRLDVNDAGFDVALDHSVVVSSGIDLHVWWPRSGRPPFGFYGSPHGPPGEMGSVVLSEDGRRAAVIHDRMRGIEDAALVLDLERIDAPPIRIRPSGSKQATRIALSPDGTLVALVLDTSDEVLLFRTEDGAEVARLPTTQPSAIAWLDASSLLVSGPALSIWRRASGDGAVHPQ